MAFPLSRSGVSRLLTLLGLTLVVPGLATCSDDGSGPNQPPEVEITSPSDGAAVSADTELALRGSATDPEEGELTGSALTWTSNQEGIIGEGSEATAIDLSLGSHEITLSATDSEGAQGSASVSIAVEGSGAVAGRRSGRR